MLHGEVLAAPSARSSSSPVVVAFAPWVRRLEGNGILLFGVVSLLYWGVTVLLAVRKLMWNDELYTYYVATLPSVHDIWAALMTGGEQTPPFFYLTTRMALDLFGSNNVSIRLPGMVGFWVMSACLFVFVRRRTSALPALCAAMFPLVTMAYYYAFEARAYGMVLGFTSVALLSWQSVALNRHRVVSLLCLAASLSAAVSSHYYAVFTVLPLALAELTRSLGSRRVDVAVWAALIAPAVPLALHLPLIRTGHTYSSAFWALPQWVKVPVFYEYLLLPAVVPVAAILVLTAVAVAMAGNNRSGVRGTAVPTVSMGETVAASAFTVIPFVEVLAAKLATGAFVNRYAMPAVLGFAVLAGFGTAAAHKKQPMVGVIAAICLIGWFVLSQSRELVQPTGHSLPVSQFSVARAADWLGSVSDRTLPFVVADPHTFVVLSHHGSPEVRERIVYLADPDRALKTLGHNSVERGMLGLVKPWFHMNVVPFEAFITRQRRFLIYGDFIRLGFLNWLLPELQARGMRLELLNRQGDCLFLLASDDGFAATAARVTAAPQRTR